MDMLMRLIELRLAIVSIMLDRILFNTKTAKKIRNARRRLGALSNIGETFKATISN